MKIIFLDIDGVLNSHRSMIAKAGKMVELPSPDWAWRMQRIAEVQARMLDPVAIGLLNRLTSADETIKLVISSTHRHFAYENGKLRQDYLEDYMQLLGVTGEVIGATPHLDIARGAEIKQWLQLHAPVPVDNYIIIDDDDDMLPEQMPRFVQTDRDNGFTFANFRMAQVLLGVTDEQLFGKDR